MGRGCATHRKFRMNASFAPRCDCSPQGGPPCVGQRQPALLSSSLAERYYPRLSYLYSAGCQGWAIYAKGRSTLRWLAVADRRGRSLGKLEKDWWSDGVSFSLVRQRGGLVVGMFLVLPSLGVGLVKRTPQLWCPPFRTCRHLPNYAPFR